MRLPRQVRRWRHNRSWKRYRGPSVISCYWDATGLHIESITGCDIRTLDDGMTQSYTGLNGLELRIRTEA